MPKPRRLPVRSAEKKRSARRSARRSLSLLPRSSQTSRHPKLTQEQRINQPGHSRTNLNRSSPSIIQHAELERPTLGGPNPMHHGAVDASGPKEEEDAGGEDSTSFGCGTDEDGWDEGGEHVLVAGEGRGLASRARGEGSVKEPRGGECRAGEGKEGRRGEGRGAPSREGGKGRRTCSKRRRVLCCLLEGRVVRGLDA